MKVYASDKTTQYPFHIGAYKGWPFAMICEIDPSKYTQKDGCRYYATTDGYTVYMDCGADDDDWATEYLNRCEAKEKKYV